MKSRRRRRRTALVRRIDRLVAVLIFQLMVDVGRQRHLSEFIQDFLKDALVGEAHKAIAVLGLSHNLADEFPLAEADLRSDGALSAGLHQGLPGSVLFSREEQNLHLGSRAHLFADEARRDYLRVV